MLRRPRNAAGLPTWFHCTVGATPVLAGIEGNFAATQSDQRPVSAANMRKQRKNFQVSFQTRVECRETTGSFNIPLRTRVSCSPAESIK